MVRVRDTGRVQGVLPDQLVGGGPVVGLSSTGDSSQSPFTVQSVAAMLQRFGVTVDCRKRKSKNVAAVMPTTEIPAIAHNDSKLDVTVSSLGDAVSGIAEFEGVGLQPATAAKVVPKERTGSCRATSLAPEAWRTAKSSSGS
jgi:flagellar basal body P-ring protein FlgI